MLQYFRFLVMISLVVNFENLSTLSTYLVHALVPQVWPVPFSYLYMNVSKIVTGTCMYTVHTSTSTSTLLHCICEYENV